MPVIIQDLAGFEIGIAVEGRSRAGQTVLFYFIDNYCR